MRGHVKAGYEMVIRALGYAPPYAHIIAEHHERCDGSGYPGNRLPHQVALDSQLVAVVDAFDALTSRRPYKAAVSAFEALRVMRVTMRGQFNDELIREFIKLLGGWSSLNEDLSAALRGAG
jgi:HD-GYP domain-containing protein (c-di-GMP phosphodiesterase class II)